MAAPYSLQEAAAEVGELIERATDAHLTEPEWQLNIAICDVANSNPAVGEDIVRALQKKLRSEAPRTVLQTLVLIETVVKNGPKSIHAQIGTRAFLNDVAALTDGSLGFDVQNQSLLLIKQWADAFSGSALTAFQDMYRQLKLQGVEFPESENDVPIFTPPPSSVAAPAALSATGSFRVDPRAGSSSKRTRDQQIDKLHLDLQVVMDKITQFRDVWTSGASGDELENMLDFLRQCQPRMNTLIEGGIMGKIDEKTLEKCLTVRRFLTLGNLTALALAGLTCCGVVCLQINDHLIKALEESRPSSSSSQNADLMSFDSPPRASRKSDFSDGMGRLNLQQGSRSNSEDDDIVSV